MSINYELVDEYLGSLHKNYESNKCKRKRKSQNSQLTHPSGISGKVVNCSSVNPKKYYTLEECV